MGADLPDFSSEPRWASAADSGELSELGAGFWKDDVTENVHSCKDITELLESGVELTDASVLTGVTTPAPPKSRWWISMASLIIPKRGPRPSSGAIPS